MSTRVSRKPKSASTVYPRIQWLWQRLSRTSSLPDRKVRDRGLPAESVTLPVIAASVADVGREWRFVVVDGRVVAGSGYDADARSAAASGEDTEARKLAEEIALSMPPPAAVYVLDICRVGDDYRLLELNPFGGADLYDCDVHGIVEAVSNYACDHCQNGDF